VGSDRLDRALNWLTVAGCCRDLRLVAAVPLTRPTAREAGWLRERTSARERKDAAVDSLRILRVTRNSPRPRSCSTQSRNLTAYS